MQHGYRHEDLVAQLDAADIPPDVPVAVQFPVEPGRKYRFEPYRVPARNTVAVMRFRGGPGQHDRAAEAWAFELTYFFLRGVGEAPSVSYAGGVYTCTGLMTTTHPGDQVPLTEINRFGEPASLDFVLHPERVRVLKDSYSRMPKFDGRDGE